MKIISKTLKKDNGRVYEYMLCSVIEGGHVCYCVSLMLAHRGAASRYLTPAIFTSAEKAGRLYKMAVNYLITPTDMPYVLEDLICI